MERKVLYKKTVTVRIQQNTKIAFCGKFKDVGWTLRHLKSVFGNKPLGSVTQDEFAEAVHDAYVIKKLHDERRRQG